MIDSEVQRVIDDLKRASTCVFSPSTAYDVLDRVLMSVASIVEGMERSQRGKLYCSIYADSAGENNG